MSNSNSYSLIKTYTGFNVLQCIAYIFVIMFSFGAMNIYFSDRNNYCAMTYMFEYPQFVKITMPPNKQYAQYGLYAYSEGRATEKTRKMWFDGIPVLFLPGNSGSYMQVRSLASVALRKALEDGYTYHFDYFTVDYNEELSGLYGGVLEGQTQFATLCITKILSLYKYNKYTRTIPTSIILIGHSMGGVIAKRLLTYNDTKDSAIVAIALAAPLQGPVVNVDVAMNDYYMTMQSEWNNFTKFNSEFEKKILLSFGNGPRDLLIPSALIYSPLSHINALTTSIPGVWVSPDHVSIVWCKQLVLTINRFLFSIIDRKTSQIVEDKKIKIDYADQYFQAKRSMVLNPMTQRANTAMLPDAFWYEDNRRIYQIKRPEIEKTTYLMIRLVSFPHNRFVAIETVDLEDKDWIFGCNAKYVHNMHRYCNEATSLTELSRWSAAGDGFGRRKLATVNLHSLQNTNNWTHVIVKISPTRKPVTLNVDINDYHSRQISITNGWNVFMNTVVVKEETEANSLFYELTINGFNVVHQAFLLYVEPVSCKTNQYHASAEFHVPWAENHEYYHYFTFEKRSPMKLRLFKNNPNVTVGLDQSEPVKVTLLLDPQCVFTIKLTASWYHSLAQLARNYSQVLVSYLAALTLLAARNNLLHLKEHGTCISIHSAVAKDGMKHFYIIVFEQVLATLIFSVPLLRFLNENASDNNHEIQYFIRSMLVIPAYITAFGLFNVFAAIILFVLVFSSQFTYKLLYRVLCRGGRAAEGAARALQTLPLLASAALVGATPLSCGAASLLAGAIFYAFKISKLYEEYLEDFAYKLLAKVSSYLCRVFYLKKKDTSEATASSEIARSPHTIEDTKRASDETDEEENGAKENERNRIVPKVAEEERIDDSQENELNPNCSEIDSEIKTSENDTDKSLALKRINNVAVCSGEDDIKTRREKDIEDIDEDLSDLNFHTTMFFMWLIVTLVNAPVLFSWARNYKYSMTLVQRDTSSIPGLLMSTCSFCLWQLKGPRQNLKHYGTVCASLYVVAGVLLVLGPLQLYIVSYGITFMFVLVTVQQVCDKQQDNGSNIKRNDNNKTQNKNTQEGSETNEDNKSECDVCSEGRIYNMFRRFKEKFNIFENI